MKNTEIEKLLRQSVSDITPPPLSENVINACREAEPDVRQKARRLLPRRLATVAAAFLLPVLVGIGVWAAFAASSAEAPASLCTTVVSLDVNPSISMDVDEHETVLGVTALNDDGARLLDGRRFSGQTVDRVVDTLVTSMVDKGYLNDKANSVLITVNNRDDAYAQALQQRLSDKVIRRFADDCFDGAVLAQHMTEDEELSALATDKQISVGKAQLIRQILKADPLKSFDELSALSIHELHLVADRSSVPAVTKNGKASDKAYIGTDAAVQTALAHLRLSADAVKDPEAELDYEHGTMCYEIEFRTDTTEYEMLVDATLGTVLDIEEEPLEEDDVDGDDLDDDDFRKPTKTDRDVQTTVMATTATTTVSNISTVPATTTAPPTAFITAEQALEIAKAYAGVETADVRAEHELDTDDGHAVYEIEFTVNDTEYDFEIDAVTGAILKYSAEADN